ncbi:succinylglutamate-semialdehyde dehydrogenase [Bdellovibrio bacteriovorus]|uniref:Succinylglutamic semialdehyde dehydrogenase n=1 Tax=Bdellovibrio bacteriovorus (strain ATCC 15356 / DSM 50701 / NCIMB 9529 / HD100) TaxID=264462 RepID=Q6MRF6_BDEBA|nr:succinylglutamate-semialdehyde dehydrogenase [Bdellovibrio bacteriovorus]AHZ85778.1 succinylglutamate-semialdehyde dehydrogenase [Bdellovibrio bacteriovorus]BEV66698.1 N-succinylglutamate 5-semialdehyde dehydrogenase [Bdellovibrio bacteriovorus]CAE77802.1 succinylglutamic semialdehyde dehydrogenase [Bdellovibrio bacteriovorus HD100]
MSTTIFPIKYKGDFINGRFVPVSKGDGEFKDISPADLSDLVMTVPFKNDHIDEACVAAKKAYMGWAMLSVDERRGYLMRLKELFDSHAEQMAQVISRDTGKPTWEALTEAKALGAKIDITLNQSLNLVAEERIPNALPQVEGVIRYRSRGVMAVVGPFNFPAHLPNGHIIPALIAGNTVVFKPSEQTPAVGQFMAEIYEKAQFPPGVFNLVQGAGAAGGRLVANEHVDGILFTGSYEVGLKIKQETLNHYWKILALEMGGKNATVVWDDADMDKAIYESLVGSYMTAGQRCSCTSRIILHPKIADEFTERFYQAAKKLSIGHWTENTFMGPLINEAAVEKYIRFQEIANRENCESLMRGKALDLKHKGYYVTPSIHLVNKFDPNSVYQKSEIFGPNVAIYQSDNFDEAMNIVNSSGYGLVMALFSKNKELYEQALLKARVGLLNWNRTTNGSSSRLPFGGMGKSGNDRPSAHFAIQYCTVPVASLEDATPFDPTKILPGMNLDMK